MTAYGAKAYAEWAAEHLRRQATRAAAAGYGPGELDRLVVAAWEGLVGATVEPARGVTRTATETRNRLADLAVVLVQVLGETRARRAADRQQPEGEGQ